MGERALCDMPQPADWQDETVRLRAACLTMRMTCPCGESWDETVHPSDDQEQCPGCRRTVEYPGTATID